jgi:hypothetical protein
LYAWNAKAAKHAKKPKEQTDRQAAIFGSILISSNAWSPRFSSACAENVDRSAPGVAAAQRG